MDTKIEQYVDFLMDSAESLTKKIKAILPDTYEEIEIIYFIAYVMCDLLRAINLPDDQLWEIIDEFQKRHLLMMTIKTSPHGTNEHIAFLNEKSVVQADRMNEFNNSTPLLVGIAKENDKIIHNLVCLASSYICLNKNEIMQFSEKLFPMLKEHSQNYIEKLGGWIKVSGIVDRIISQEKIIHKMVRDHITDIPNELELYYYRYFLVYSFYEKQEMINQNILTNYSSKSLDNIIRSINGDVEKDEILKKRNERFEDYEILRHQMDFDDSEKSSRWATVLGSTASDYIYGKIRHELILTVLDQVLE